MHLYVMRIGSYAYVNLRNISFELLLLLLLLLLILLLLLLLLLL